MEEIGKALPWLGFWFFMSVVWYCDHKQYLAGYDSMFFEHKTEAEKKIRDNIVNSKK
jgi:hypothetical protein